ncbi:uncharacterized protein LOC132746230 [Ruditapes philippinarum]|uniref:uncharacterized protein LOC132746230 n=1 Tax=Ruditapes philippinarum TaxID=129788 RepID=UPI00295BAFCC|nr:uncharacterized protein LOC132746230 [Ruditapes philippinarum]
MMIMGYFALKLFLNNFFKHIIVVNEVYRQDEDSLINAVNELEKGVPSERTNEFLKTLSRPLNVPSTEVIKLFARNIDADICNYNILNELPGEIFTFDSQDFGDTYFLRKFIAPKHLGLKINAKVMLLTNLTDEYVNGLVGTIVNINHKCIEVNFDGKIVKITRILFTKYDPVTSVILSQRYQFPLRLAYAVTIHKSQGMTIPFVEIDCKNAYSPGQLGVAVGRAVSTTGLRVLNYNQNIVKKHPDKINLFYKSIDSSTLVTDLSDNICCSSLVSTTELTESDMKGGSESETIKGTQSTSLPIHSDSSDSESEELLNILSSFHEEHNYYASSSHVSENMVRAFEIAIQDYIGTSEEVPVRQACALLLKSDQCVSWYKVQHEKVRVMFETSFTAEPGKNQPCHLSNFYASFNKYICSTEYLQEMEQFSNIHYGHEILTSVMFAIQAYRMEHKSHLVNFEKVDVNVFPKQQCPPGNDGKLRYIAGYTIAKCRYRLCSALRNRLFVPGMEIEINQLNEKIKILDTCIVSGTDIVKETKYPKSLEEIHRKQNEREGLTNVTDRTFEFFCKLQQTAVILMSFESLKSQRKYLFRYVYNNVVKNTTVLESFEKNFAVSFVHVNSTYYEKDKHCIQELLESMSAFCSHVVTLFEMIVKLFITVMFSQFRKDYLRVVKREKGKALRKKIMEKNEKNAFQHVTMDFIRNDMSTDKTISHLKLKTDALSDPLFYKNFKKAELLQLLKCYNESISSGSSKNDIGEYLTDILTNPECVKMCNPTCLQEQYTENTNNLEKLKTRTTVNNEQPHLSEALSVVGKKVTTFAENEEQ